MLATVNCPQCNAPLEVPDNIPAGKRLQCPDCGTAFSPPGRADSSESRSRRHVEVELPRRSKGGSLAIIAAITLIILMGLGIASAIVWIYLDDLRAREDAAAEAASANKNAAANQPIGRGGAAGGGNGIQPGGGAGGMPGNMRGGPPGGGMGGGPPGDGGMVPMPGGRGGVKPVQLKLGEPAPEIEGEDLDGKPMKLSDFRGKVVLLHFWGDGSDPWRTEYAFLNNLINRMKAEPFVLLGVNCDVTKDAAKTAMKNNKLGWRAWYDCGPAMDGPIYKRYGVTTVPNTFIIDKEGVLRQHFTGQQADVTLDMAVDSVLAQGEKRPADAPTRWKPGSTGFSQLGDEIEVGRYRIRPPKGYTAEPVKAEPARQTYRWKGPRRPDGFVAVLEVTLTTGEPANKKLEEILEKDLQAISGSRLGWNCEPAGRGEIDGLTFARTHWSIMESLNPPKWKKFGVLYAAVDGATMIRISHQDSIATYNSGAEAAPLTIRRLLK